jgi:hypothetical protein
METQEALHTDPCETHTPFAALKWWKRSLLPVTN